MKSESKKAHQVGPLEFGGGCYRIFGSIAPETKTELTEQLVQARESGIDALEIIVNRYQEPEQFSEDLKAGKALLGNIPVSLRIKEKGTDDQISSTEGIAMLDACVRKGLTAFIDVEADGRFAERARALSSSSEVKLIFTQQNYRGVAGVKGVLEAAKTVEAMGPDLVRVLYLAADDVDMLQIAQAARKANTGGDLKTPFSFSAIGEAGLMLRLFGERCGNDFGSYPLYRKESENFEFETLEEYRRLREIYTIDGISTAPQKENGDVG